MSAKGSFHSRCPACGHIITAGMNLTVFQIISERGEMTVGQIWAAVKLIQPDTTIKHIYNALGNLHKRGKIKHPRYGTYEAS